MGKTLQRFSLVSAVQDSRFPPIVLTEFPALKVEISLLSDFEKIDSPEDWTVGKHGIEIEFEDGKTPEVYRGTFLPNVAPEQGWDVNVTLQALVRKAGYRGSYESVKDNFKLVRRYQSIKFGMDFATWQEHHNR